MSEVQITTQISQNEDEWKSITPEVNSSAEFLEIVTDFGNPLEIVREAISNAIDWGSKCIKISFSVAIIDGQNRLVVRFEDDGVGMNRTTLERDFWGLGFSNSRNLKQADNIDLIGEKGHGTKIYLRSQLVTVRTRSDEGSYEAICVEPFTALNRGLLHQPKVRAIEELETKGTTIEIIGYNDNERSKFVQHVVKDYINWFTKAGSIELMLGIEKWKDFKVLLKCVDRNDFEEIPFGHYFPPENADIQALFEEFAYEASDRYVKRIIKKGIRLARHPEVTFDLVVSVEGDEVKRQYNPMIRQRNRTDTGRYTVTERYGVYLCKDYIPVTKARDWISGFGLGASSLTLIHGFVNCQSLKLTANRGNYANTSPLIIEELREKVQEEFDEIDHLLRTEGIYQLKIWQDEDRTLKQEQDDFKVRVKSIKGRAIAQIGERTFIEPANETEMMGFFTSIYPLFSDDFDFEMLDYNSNRGIDSIARNKTGNDVRDSEFWYVELKHILQPKFNHGFEHLRSIVCWDFHKTIAHGTEFTGIEKQTRRLTIAEDEQGFPLYYLDPVKGANRVEVIKLKEYLKLRKGIEFQTQIKVAT